MNTHVNLVGLTGTAYSYEIAAMDTAWNAVAGNYAFAKETELGTWRVLYVGEAGSLKDCLGHHALWREAQSFGCTHVLAHLNDDGDQARHLEQHDLIVGLKPPMNLLHH